MTKLGLLDLNLKNNLINTGGLVVILNNINDVEFEIILDVRENFVIYGISLLDVMEEYNMYEVDDYVEGKKDNILIKFENVK